MNTPQAFTIETAQVDRVIEFLMGEFEDPLHAALACLTAYVVICEQHSGAPDRAAIARHANQVILSMASGDEPGEVRPN